jgi:hypothetical protein
VSLTQHTCSWKRYLPLKSQMVITAVTPLALLSCISVCWNHAFS